VHNVYRTYDLHGRLLYIGETDNVRRRFYQHKSEGIWLHRMTERCVREYADPEYAKAVEVRAIRMLRPMYNVRDRVDRSPPPPMTDEEVSAMIEWLNAGMPNRCSDAPKHRRE